MRARPLPRGGAHQAGPAALGGSAPVSSALVLSTYDVLRAVHVSESTCAHCPVPCTAPAQRHPRALPGGLAPQEQRLAPTPQGCVGPPLGRGSPAPGSRHSSPGLQRHRSQEAARSTRRSLAPSPAPSCTTSLTAWASRCSHLKLGLQRGGSSRKARIYGSNVFHKSVKRTQPEQHTSELELCPVHWALHTCMPLHLQLSQLPCPQKQKASFLAPLGKSFLLNTEQPRERTRQICNHRQQSRSALSSAVKSALHVSRSPRTPSALRVCACAQRNLAWASQKDTLTLNHSGGTSARGNLGRGQFEKENFYLFKILPIFES